LEDQEEEFMIVQAGKKKAQVIIPPKIREGGRA